MGHIALVSSKGSPGVTTTAVALADVWPGANSGRAALMADLDPIGGDVAAGLLRGALVGSAGVLALAASRGLGPLEAIDMAAVDIRGDGSSRVLPGVPDQARAPALSLAWDVLREALPDLDASGTDLIVDAGRVGEDVGSTPWVMEADVCVLVVRPTLPSVAAAHRLVRGWSPSRPSLQAVIVQSAMAYRADEVADALGIPVLAALPFDEATARAYSDGAARQRRHDRTPLCRSVVGLAEILGAQARPPRAGGGREGVIRHGW